MDTSAPLRLAVLRCTSAEEGFGLEAALKGDPLGSGWRSAPGGCSPQELVVGVQGGGAQLPQLARAETQSIQFVAHEHFVPSLVEIWVSTAATSTQALAPGAPWTRLGHVKMGSNGRVAAGRERKTVRIKVQATAVKLVLSAPIPDAANTLGQVGIVSFLVSGSVQDAGASVVEAGPADAPAEAPAAARPGAPGRAPQASGRPPLGPQFAQYRDKVEAMRTELLIRKTRAVADEDFVNAERFKLAYDKLGDMWLVYERLEAKKAAAIAREEYRAANELKGNITEMKAVFDMELEPLVRFLNGEAPLPPPAPERPAAPRQAPRQDSAPTSARGAPAPQAGSQPSSRTGSRPGSASAAPAAAQGMASINDRVWPGSNSPQLNAQGERMIKPMSDEERERLFRLDEQTKAEMESEKQAILAEKTVQERQRNRRGPRRAAGEAAEGEPEPARPGRQPATPSVRRSLGPGRGLDASTASPSSTVPAQGDLMSEIAAVCDSWEKSSTPPADISGTFGRSKHCTVLRSLEFPEMFLRLACSKTLSHAQDVIPLMEKAVEQSPERYYPAAIALISLVAENPNAGIMGHCFNLFARTYKAILIVVGGLAPESLRIVSLDYVSQMIGQKDTPGKYNRMECSGASPQKLAGIEANPAFVQTVAELLAPALDKLGDNRGRIKYTALNLLATTADYPAFPAKPFITSLLGQKAVERSVGLSISSLNQADQKDNRRLQHAIETRAWAGSALILNAPGLITSETVDIIIAFCNWVIPQATRQEEKKPCIELLVALYSQPHGFEKAIACANACSGSTQLLHNIYNSFAFADKQLGIGFGPDHRECRCIYAEERAGSKATGAKIIAKQASAAGQGAQQPTPARRQTEAQGSAPQAPAAQAPAQAQKGEAEEFPPGVCQFCLWEAPDLSAETLYHHLLTDCPCCCACPNCEMVVEIPCLADHMIYECARTHNLPYEFAQCRKCRTLQMAQNLAEHEAHCTYSLSTAETICPLCGEFLQDEEMALAHYSDGEGCRGNPRTAPELRKIVDQKVG